MREDQLPGHRDQHGSYDAAVVMAASAATLRQDVLAAIAAAGPMTAFEIAAHLDCPFSNAQPRISELKAAGRIHWNGEKRTSARSKVKVKVWALGSRRRDLDSTPLVST